MLSMLQDLHLDGVPLVRLESDFLRTDVAPSVGGRIISLVEKRSGHEFLWRNSKLKLEKMPSRSQYDPNFYGGIDELLPNDIPEVINGVDCPDHGELWTTPLEDRSESGKLVLRGALPKFGLRYEREMSLDPEAPRLMLTYRISNRANQPRQFLWKLHAALAIEAGDVIECPARKAQVVDLAWSRFKTLAPFSWPNLEGQAANVIPPRNGTVDFFYLFDLAQGAMAWRSHSRHMQFRYEFDTKVFPYAWLFASYGGFRGHYTVIVEPCTAMPLSVNEAAGRQQCSWLEPGQTLETHVSIYAGVARLNSKGPTP
jgi:hypothetical protein